MTGVVATYFQPSTTTVHTVFGVHVGRAARDVLRVAITTPEMMKVTPLT